MNEYFEKINLLASELSNMSPKTQMEIVKLCKNICLQLNEAIENGVVATNEDIATLQEAITNLETSVAEFESETNSNITNLQETTTSLQDAITNLQNTINEIPIIHFSTDGYNKVSVISRVVNGLPTQYQVTHTHCYFVEIIDSSNTLKLYFNLYTDKYASDTLTADEVFLVFASLPYDTGFIASGVMDLIGSLWHITRIIHRYAGTSVIRIEGVASGMSPYGITISRNDFINTSLYTVTAKRMY